MANTNMRQILYILSSIIVSLVGYARNCDKPITDAIVASDWFALDSIYTGAPKDSISDFLEIYSRCLIGNRFNRTDVSIPAFTELFETQSGQMDLNTRLSSALMFAMDISRAGENQKAAHVLNSVISEVSSSGSMSSLESYRQFATLYSALSAFSPYRLAFDNDTVGTIPFALAQVGPKEKGNVVMRLKQSTLNGLEANINFDTGAGINIISEEVSAKYDLTPLNLTLSVKGVRSSKGRYVMAKELKLGNITLRDVPFLVLPMSAKNKEGDKFFSKIEIIVGSEVMLHLKDVTLDFENNEIIVPAVPPVRSGERPNMHFSASMNLDAKVLVRDTPVVACIDTGNTSFGNLNHDFFKNNEDYVLSHSTKENFRVAGIGGVHKEKCYRTSDLPLTLGKSNVIVPYLDVFADKKVGVKNNIGLRTLIQYKKIRFNMVDFCIFAD